MEKIWEKKLDYYRQWMADLKAANTSPGDDVYCMVKNNIEQYEKLLS